MSDFDKEAEREKLREKYERDKQKREATQRMSDLLLKGARMTNAHCDTCGDPLFQQNDVTFCPSCHGGPEGVTGPAPEADTDDAPAEGNTDAPTPSDGDDASRAATEIEVDGSRSVDTGSPAEAEQSTDAKAPSEPGGQRATSSTDRQPRRSRRSRRPSSASADVAAGRASLIEALEKFASEAAATDDPRYARECLEAAREASEALEALDR